MSTRNEASQRRTAGRAGPCRASMRVILRPRWERPLRGGTRVVVRSQATGLTLRAARAAEQAGVLAAEAPLPRQPKLAKAGHSKPISTPVSAGGGQMLVDNGPKRKPPQGALWPRAPRCGRTGEKATETLRGPRSRGRRPRGAGEPFDASAPREATDPEAGQDGMRVRRRVRGRLGTRGLRPGAAQGFSAPAAGSRAAPAGRGRWRARAGRSRGTCAGRGASSRSWRRCGRAPSGAGGGGGGAGRAPYHHHGRSVRSWAIRRGVRPRGMRGRGRMTGGGPAPGF
jgi:hypothetical protein